eukprot:3589349-Lingulodinium_polyedra.AAC.1
MLPRRSSPAVGRPCRGRCPPRPGQALLSGARRVGLATGVLRGRAHRCAGGGSGMGGASSRWPS